MRHILEICAFNLQSCIIAEKAGAVRVELCDNPIEGGTTPSYGTIKMVREKIDIDLYPIIRPRSMNYYYDAEEWEIILEDIRMCKELGCNGVSVGAQNMDGSIDADRMKEVVELAYPLKVTCNRAFDAVPNPFQALETLISVGCERVLTSGLAPTAPEGGNLLTQLVNQASGHISLMPGAGVRSTNLQSLIDTTGAWEYHTSARMSVPNPMSFSNPLISDAGNLFVADEKEVNKMIAILKTAV